jgi:hypothetical protein
MKVDGRTLTARFINIPFATIPSSRWTLSVHAIDTAGTSSPTTKVLFL